MKSCFLLLLFLIATYLPAQSAKDSAKPDLSKFTSEQLTTCFDDSKVSCSSDQMEITSELYSRIPTMPVDQLVSCFANWKICGASEDGSSGWPISDELAHRGKPHQLLERFWTEKDPEIRNGIIHVAYHFNTPEVTAFMQKILAEKIDDGEYLYWPANYLAKQCDADGLNWLSSKPQRSKGCLQFATTVSLFGKCHYRPAIPYLINYSLNDACLNVVGEAESDLRSMYTSSPKEFKSIEEMHKYFCGRAKREGFKIKCATK
jgi:hypothetical protein